MIKTEPKNQLSEILYSAWDKADHDDEFGIFMERICRTITMRALYLAFEITQNIEPAHIDKLIEGNAYLKDKSLKLKFDIAENEKRTRENLESEARGNKLFDDISVAFLSDGDNLCERDRSFLLKELKRFIMNNR